MTSPDARLETAAITGAASGIGAAFARRLAARNVKLWLIDKQADALNALAAELRAAHAVEVETIHADLVDDADQAKVEMALAGLDRLDLLINNAGFGDPGGFLDLPAQRHLDMLQVHAAAPVRLCRAVLPAMKARQRGAIVNVCSLVQYLHLPGNTMYGATKTFLDAFSRSLAREVAPHGITVQVLIPGYTKSGFHHTDAYRRSPVHGMPGFVWLSADAVAAASLRALETGKLVCVPSAMNRVAAFFLRHRLFSYRLLRPWVA